MSCAACSARVEKAVCALENVSNAEVNLLSGTMTLEAKNASEATAVILAVEKAGYRAQSLGEKKKIDEKAESGEGQSVKQIVISAAFLLVLMYFTMGHMIGLPLPSWYHGNENRMAAGLLQMFLTLPIVFVNRVYYQRGIKALFHGGANMDTLIAVGSGAALLQSTVSLLAMAYAVGHQDFAAMQIYGNNLYFESAAMILTLIRFGKYLESRAKGRAGDAVKKLMDLRPKTATVLRGGQEHTIPIEDVVVGDILALRSGEIVAVDGVVLEGFASLDQSAITGESLPVDKKQGDDLTAASVCTHGYLTYRAVKVGEDTTLSQIIHLVEQAGGSKAPIARLADKVAGVFVPVVMAIACLTFLGWIIAGYGVTFALSNAISVLVISCPCALGLATPVAIMVGTGRGAGMGVLFKNAQALESLHKVNAVVLDKTGTLTLGKPVVTDVFAGKIGEKRLLEIAGALEQHSEHPFAAAILEYTKSMALPMVSNFKVLPGQGVMGQIDGKGYLGGNAQLMASVSAVIPPMTQWESAGKTPIYFASDSGEYLGCICAADILKEDAPQTIKRLKDMNIEAVMLTGDNAVTAKAIAASAGITSVVSQVLPADKAGVILEMRAQGKHIVMVGDGINDAPALTAADVGVAMGSGTDIAMESADIVLMGSHISAIADAISLSKATIRNIKQNLFWAFFYNILGIPVAAGLLYPALGVVLSPMIGAAAMSFSSIFVVSNALRLRFFASGFKANTPNEQQERKEENMVIQVEGMMCSHCKARVESVCKAVPGTVDAVVDLAMKTVTVTGTADKKAICDAITQAGYEVID